MQAIEREREREYREMMDFEANRQRQEHQQQLNHHSLYHHHQQQTQLQLQQQPSHRLVGQSHANLLPQQPHHHHHQMMQIHQTQPLHSHSQPQTQPQPQAAESKKDKKRREVIDRIHRVHWDTVENRDMLYQDLFHALSSTYSTLLLSPEDSRLYNLSHSRLCLSRDSALRQIALLASHQRDGARKAYQQDRNEVEEAARAAKRAVRDRMLGIIEERKRRLREEKEGGEVAVDAFFESSSRPHATRKLRNKGAASRSRRLGAVGEERSTPALAAGGEDSESFSTGNNAGSSMEDSNNPNSMFRSSSTLGSGVIGASGIGGTGIGISGTGGIPDLAGLGLGSSSKTNDMLIMSGLGRVGLEELAGYSDLMSGNYSNQDDRDGLDDNVNGNTGSSVGGNSSIGLQNPVTHAQISAKLGLSSVGSSNASTTSGIADLGLGLALNLPTNTTSSNASSNNANGNANNPLNGVSNSTINENPSSLLGLDTGMGDSSYMRGSTTNPKGNPVGGGAGASGHIVSVSGSTGPSLKRKTIAGGGGGGGGGELDDDGNGNAINGNGGTGGIGTKNPKSSILTALGGCAGPGVGVITHGMGPGIPAVRWDVGKSLTGLTTAKDLEVESDLLGMRKAGGKRRRRG